MYMKKTLAVILAVVLAFSSLAVASFAGTTVNFDEQAADATEARSAVTFKIFRKVDGDWVDAEGLAKRGEEIQVRVYLESNYYVGDAQILLCLTKGFFDFSSLTKSDILFDSTKLSEVEYNSLSNTTRLTKDGYAYQMSAEDYAQYDYLYFQPYRLVPVSSETVSGTYWGSKGSDDDYYFAFPGTVAEDADSACEGIEGTITSISNADMTKANAYGYNNFSYYDVASQKSYASYNWLSDDEQRPVYNAGSVKVVNDVVFLPGEDCKFDAADDDSYTITDYIKEEISDAKLAAIPDILDADSNVVTVSGWAECDSTGKVIDGTKATSISADYETKYYVPVTGQSVIKFDANGGTFTADSAETKLFTDDPGAAFTDTVPGKDDVTRDGYEFNCWLDDSGAEADFTDLKYADPVGTTTFTADWTATEKTITYWVDGELLEDSQNPQTVACGSAINTITPSSKLMPAGYRFIKWQTYDEATKTYGEVPATMPSENLDLYALLEPETVKVNYVIDGTFKGEKGADVGSAVPVNVTGSIIGYNGPAYGSNYFDGWYTNESCTEKLASDAKVPAAGLTLYAKTEIPATFDANGGKFADGSDEAVTYAKYYGDITAPDSPTLVGSTFKGWTPSVGIMDEAAGKTFTATWEKIEYTYTFVIDGHTEVDDGNVLGDSIDQPNTDIPGKKFIGWSLVKNDENEIVEVPATVTAPAADTTYYAIFEPVEYTVNYYIDGNVEHTDTYDYDDTITVWSAPKKDGSTFDGWYLNNATPLAGDKLTAITIGEETEEVINVYGQYVDGKFTATFNANGGKFADDETSKEVNDLAYNAEISFTTEPVRTGYNFLGWSRDAAATKADDSLGKMDSENGVTFYAVWEANEYTATFFANGGKFAGEADEDKFTENVDFGSAIPVPAAPTRDGYVFNGWKASADAETTLGTAAQPELGKMDSENGKQFYADWSSTAATVIYDANGGKFDDGATYKTAGAAYGSAIEAYATNPEKSGSEFLGWSRKADATAADTSLGNVDSSNVTVYAVYSAKLLKATFDANGGKFADEATTSKNVAYGATINDTDIDEPAKTGYTFLGWSRDKNADPATFDDNTPLGEMDSENGVTFYAVWKANTHTITYMVDGSVYGEVETYSFGDAITIREAASKEGYTFSGWTPATLAATMPDEDITVNGSFTVAQYNITYYIDGAQYGEAESLDFNATVSEKAKPSKTGYDFSGWNWYKVTEDGNVELASAPATMPAADLIAKGTYTAHKNDVKFLNDVGGTAFATFNDVAYGTAKSEFTPEGNPTKEGYTFKEWTPAIPETMTDEELTFEPVFEANKHSVTYNLNGGKAAEGATYVFTDVAYGTAKASYTPSGDPTKDGFVFAGWDKVIPDTMPDEDLVFTAKWNSVAPGEITYTVSAYYAATDGTYSTSPSFSTADAAAEGTKIELSDISGAGCPDGFELDSEKSNITVINSLSATENALVVYYKRTTSDIVWTTSDGTITGATGNDGKEKAETGTYGATITEPEATRPGYELTGWEYSNADTGEAIEKPATVPSYPIKAEAQWQKAKFDVTYYIDGVQDGDPASTEYEATINERSKPSKTGYDFNGWDWYLASAPSTKLSGKPDSMPAENVIAKGTFTKKNVTISFSAGDGKFPENATTETSVPFGGDITSTDITEPTREGYKFNGWSRNPDGSNPGTLGTADSEGPITVYPAWAANKYNVTYDAGEGTFEGGETISDEGDYEFGSAVPGCSLGEPTKEGASFDHWEWFKDTDSTASSKAKSLFSIVASAANWIGITTPETIPANAIKAIAAYTDDTEAVFYKDYATDSATKVGVVKGEPGTVITPPATPTKDGYDFAGWYEVTDGTVGTTPVTDFGTLPATGTKEYTAKWTPKTISVLFDAMGGLIDGSGSKTVGYDYDTQIEAPADPIKEGCIFKGWSIDKTNVITDLGKASDSNNKFYAVYEEVPGVKHTVAFYTTETTPEYETQVAINGPIPGYTAINAPANKKFDSWKWYKVEGDTKTEIERPTAMPDYDVAAVAQYVDIPAEEYTVTFNCNGGSFESGTYSGRSYVSFKLTEGEAITSPAEPTRSGYIFKGWKPGTSDPAIGSAMPAHNVSYQAQWEKIAPDNFTVTYEVDGAAFQTFQVEDGAAVPTNTETPGKAGYTFKGWVWVNSSGEEISKPDTVTENLVAKAQFVKDATPDDEDDDEGEPFPEIDIDDIIVDPEVIGGLIDSLADLIPDGEIELPDWGKKDSDTDDDEDADDDADIPDTGSATGIVVFAVISGAAAAAYVFTRKKDDESDED